MRQTVQVETLGIKKFQAVTNEADKLVYELESIEVVGAGEIKLEVNMKLVKGIDYTDGGDGPRGWVGPENFTEGVQYITFTVFPLNETIESQVEANGMLLLDSPVQ